jgi:hypothetical protein
VSSNPDAKRILEGDFALITVQVVHPQARLRRQSPGHPHVLNGR